MLDKLREKLSQKVTQISEELFAPEDVQSVRLDICKTCEKFSTHNFCRACGCYMPAKIKLANQSCPLKKWMPIKKVNDEDN